jgi:hypothetical protein
VTAHPWQKMTGSGTLSQSSTRKKQYKKSFGVLGERRNEWKKMRLSFNGSKCVEFFFYLFEDSFPLLFSVTVADSVSHLAYLQVVAGFGCEALELQPQPDLNSYSSVFLVPHVEASTSECGSVAQRGDPWIWWRVKIGKTHVGRIILVECIMWLRLYVLVFEGVVVVPTGVGLLVIHFTKVALTGNLLFFFFIKKKCN